MSKPYSPSSAPEFATQHDYSDILGTSLPPTKPLQPKGAAAALAIGDPWASDVSSAQVEQPPLPTPSPSESDPWASDAAVTPAAQYLRPTVVVATIDPPVSVPAIAIVPPSAPVPTLESPASAAAIDSEAPGITAQDLALKSCRRGSKSLAAKDYARARSAYKIAVEWNPKLAIAHSGMAQVCDIIQDYEGALVAWNLAIQCDPAELDFYYQRALVNKILKNYFQVLADCKHILAQAPDRPLVRWLYAVALVKLENYQAALANLDRHIEEYPQDPNGYCYRGICRERLEQFPDALADFDRAIALQPNQPVFHHARGRTRQKLGDYHGALADFTVTIDRKPRAAVYDDRAEVHRCLGDRAAALQDCDRAIALNPKFIEAYFRRALTYTELGDLELALRDCNQTIDLAPEHITAHIQRSWIYFRQNDYRHAKQDCQAARAIDNTCFWASYMSGVINSLSGLKHNALKNFSQAIEISPNYVSARYHRGIVYHELGDIPKAMADFNQARSIQDRGLERLLDRDETGFYAEGLALYHMGQPEAARTVLILGALSAKRFNNPSFHQLMLTKIEDLGLASGELASTASNSCPIGLPLNLPTISL
ncbi:tetratricopeptide repeat protein [Chamaesiphon sp.]|uniref:tetratricopeptide repeat protein n=1 Tax=Chamaesiphon sp. TaxID=2814140 RepID=UPI003592EFC5